MAAFVGFESAVHRILEEGANVEAKTQGNLTALHIAAFMGYDSIVQQLLARGADVEAEAQWYGVEDVEEYEHGVVEVDSAEKLLENHLRRWYLEQGTVTEVGMEARHGLSARQLAASSGHFEVQPSNSF